MSEAPETAENAAAAPMSRSEKLGVALIALLPAVFSGMILLFIAALSVGEAIGSLFEAIGGTNLTRGWWVRGHALELLAILTFAAQILVTRALARGMAEPPRKRSFGRFGMLAAVLWVLTPVLIGNIPQLFEDRSGPPAEPDAADPETDP